MIALMAMPTQPPLHHTLPFPPFTLTSSLNLFHFISNQYSSFFPFFF